MRVLVAGGRDFTDRQGLYAVLDRLDETRHFTVVIHGDYRGVDWLARDWAHARDRRDDPYPAEWKRFRGRAGPIRNQRMIDEGKPDFAVLFEGGDGTADMLIRLAQAQIPYCTVGHPPKQKRPFVVQVEDWWRHVNIQM